MICIYCKSSQTSVPNSRLKLKSPAVWRRRLCDTCKKSFTTYEYPDYSKIEVVAINEKTTPFSRPKLFLSIYNAIRHMPDAANSADSLTNTVINNLLPVQGSLLAGEITLSVIKVLKNYDAAALISYVSTKSTYLTKTEIKKLLA